MARRLRQLLRRYAIHHEDCALEAPHDEERPPAWTCGLDEVVGGGLSNPDTTSAGMARYAHAPPTNSALEVVEMLKGYRMFVLVLLSACATPPIDPPFYRQYRERYAITADELKTLQFYISREVLAHALDGSPGVEPEQVVIVASRTPGLVREAGPDWVRVAFRQGGEGVLFRIRSDRADAVYALATTTESGRIALVSELPEPVLTLGGRRYKIVYGADAYLIVSSHDLGKLIESRPHPPGLERE